ncbi:MAG: DUF1080 domain-containing protein [Bacteroidetes bacterium]|nr:MAG: DUF1080 domain-containing protein [Bacteroidota bacterium]
MKTIKSLLLFIIVLFCTSTTLKSDSELIFNGKDFSGWYTYLDKHGIGKDPEKVFKIEDGILHISGKENGYLATKKSFTNYKLIVEFKWGTDKRDPSPNYKRDSGILYHMTGLDKIWPKSFECQIQESDCGDFWLIDGIEIKSKHTIHQKFGYQHIIKSNNAELPHGEWNQVEVISNNGKCTHIVNGMVVNEGTEASVQSGKILIQSEGAEIFFRRIELKPL